MRAEVVQSSEGGSLIRLQYTETVNGETLKEQIDDLVGIYEDATGGPYRRKKRPARMRQS